MIMIPFLSVSCLVTTGIAQGFVPREFGIVRQNMQGSSSSSIRSRSSFSSQRPSTLYALRGAGNDDNGAVEPSDMDSSTMTSGETMTLTLDNSRNTEEAFQADNGAAVSYLMDDNSSQTAIEIEVGPAADVEVEVNLLEENIGEDDREQVLAAGVVATLGTGNMVSEDVYLNEETGEIIEIDDASEQGPEHPEEEEEGPAESDHGGVVSGIFGNLRIPASLLAGASLGQAFALPLTEMDGLQLGLIKRAYVLCMLGSFSSMLLTVLLSTTVMTDITLSNARLAKSPSEYINRYYALDYMLTKINFFVGSAVFAIGSMLRGWMFLNFALVGRGVLGIMGSFTIMSSAIVLEYNRRQSGKSIFGQVKDTYLLMKIKTRTNKMFGIGAIIWTATVFYLLAKIPYIAQYLAK